ncbi:MAG: glycosyltransferase [Smithella sp.]|jgi:glycosyltransferase involved in cell wall biosynthesis
MNELHIMFIPSWYPTDHHPVLGTFFREQAQALRTAGIKVGVIYPDIRSTRQLSIKSIRENHFQTVIREEEGIRVVRFNGWNLPKFRRGDIFFTYQTQRLIKLYVTHFGKPDLIHAQSALWGGVAAQKAKEHLDISYVITEHSSLYGRGLIEPWQVPYLKKTFNDASAVLAVSRALGNLVEPYMNAPKVEVVPNVVDTDFFTLPHNSRNHEFFRFLSVAFLTPIKGFDILLRSFSEAFRGRKEIVLEIGGDGPQRIGLEKLAAELGISGQVRFLGMLSREEVRSAMWRANAFVLASYIETFGVVLIEALSTGLPVVATRCGGPEEFVTPEVGILMEAGNVKALAAALDAIYRDSLQFDAGLLRNYAIENFGEQKLVTRLFRIYQNVLTK